MQRGKMIRDQKRVALLKEKRASIGSSSPPRVIVLFDLSSSKNLGEVARDLLKLSSGEDAKPLSNTIASAIYKFRLMVLEAPHGDLLSCMEMAKVADLIAFVVSANSLADDYETITMVDTFGQQCLSVFRAIGLPSTAVLIRDLPSNKNQKQDFKKLCISHLSSELPEDCKFYLADTKDDLQKIMPQCCLPNILPAYLKIYTHNPRNQRPYLMSQETQLEPDKDNPGMCSLLLSGYVRAHSLSANQLVVHVSGEGDFQIGKIDILKDPFPINERKSSNSMDSEDMNNLQIIRTLLPDPLKQEPLVVENVDPLAGEQTWPTEAVMAEAETNNKEWKLVGKRLPQGTSDYQAAWIVEDTDWIFVTRMMMVDENMTKEQIEAEIKKIKEAYVDDQEFPDEVETPIDVPAKNRFANTEDTSLFEPLHGILKNHCPLNMQEFLLLTILLKHKRMCLQRCLRWMKET